MSITFIPTAGTFTTFTYFDAMGEEDSGTGAIRDGVYCSADEEPSLNVAYGNARALLKRLELGDCWDGDELVGMIPLARVPQLMDRIEYLREMEDYLYDHYGRPLLQLCYHAKWHACDISFG